MKNKNDVITSMYIAISTCDLKTIEQCRKDLIDIALEDQTRIVYDNLAQTEWFKGE